MQPESVPLESEVLGGVSGRLIDRLAAHRSDGEVVLEHSNLIARLGDKASAQGVEHHVARGVSIRGVIHDPPAGRSVDHALAYVGSVARASAMDVDAIPAGHVRSRSGNQMTGRIQRRGIQRHRLVGSTEPLDRHANKREVGRVHAHQVSTPRGIGGRRHKPDRAFEVGDVTSHPSGDSRIDSRRSKAGVLQRLIQGDRIAVDELDRPSLVLTRHCTSHDNPIADPPTRWDGCKESDFRRPRLQLVGHLNERSRWLANHPNATEGDDPARQRQRISHAIDRTTVGERDGHRLTTKDGGRVIARDQHATDGDKDRVDVELRSGAELQGTLDPNRGTPNVVVLLKHE